MEPLSGPGPPAENSSPLPTEALQEKVKQLEAENKRLGGKLRGYETLNHLFQESKEQCRQLKKENLILNQKVKNSATESTALDLVAKSSMEESVAVQRNLNDMPAVSDKTVEKALETPASLSSIPGATKGSADKENITEKPEEIVAVGMQESLAEDIKTPIWKSPTKKITPLTNVVTTDSDVLSDDEFIKFTNYKKDQETYLPPPQKSMSDVSSSRLYGPGTTQSSPDPRSNSHSPTFGSPLRNEMLISFPSLRGHTEHSQEQTAGLFEVQGGSPISIHVADDLNKMVRETLRLEQSERAWKAYATTLRSEVQDLKRRLNLMNQEKADTISLLKSENIRLLARIKKLEHERDALSPADSVSSETAVMGAGWVHVSKLQANSPENRDQVQTIDVSDLLQRIRFLELKNKELFEANKKWEDFRQSTEHVYEERMQELRQRLDSRERALTDYQIQDEKRQRDIDKMLLTSKRRCQELEEEKEELESQLEQCKNQCTAMEEQLRELQPQRLNQLSGQPAAPAAESNNRSDPQIQEIVNEKEALKQQLSIFQEDFDKERADRAKAQSEKDVLQRKLSDTSQQLKRYQTQKKTYEDAMQSSLAKNEQLHQQVATLKQQLSTSEDALNRCFDENERLRRQIQELKQTRRPEIVTPPPGGRPFYPPSPVGHPGWLERPAVYQTARPQENTPELLPGSWQCNRCTYVNYPQRTVCEVCGSVNHQTPAGHNPAMGAYGSQPNITYHWQGMNQNRDPNITMRDHLVPRGRIDSDDLTTDDTGIDVN